MTNVVSVLGTKNKTGAPPFAFDLAARFQEEGKTVLLVDADPITNFKTGWRTRGDLKKIPRPVKREWLNGFLKGAMDLPCLRLEAECEQFVEFSSILKFFDWMVVDCGPTLHPIAKDFLEQFPFEERNSGVSLTAVSRPPDKKAILKTIQKKIDEEKIKPDQVADVIRGVLREGDNPKTLFQELLDELTGLGPLEPLFNNPDTTEILVNGKEAIYIEERGRLKKTAIRFSDDHSLQKIIERILLPVGRRVDESSPMVDLRLLDGSRVHIVIPPLSIDGPMISIRRFSKNIFSPRDLIRLGTAGADTISFLEKSVSEKRNILVSGGTGSGKTTLLNLLASFIPETERIITIEDAAELRLNQPHVVRLEARPPNIEGKGAVTIRDLVRNALRMRPDRIVVGECRGGEALDMLQAMNTGHEGSLTTLHANSPKEALSRLETLVMFSGMELPSRVIREQIASAIHLVVQMARQKDGSRKIVSVAKVLGLDKENFLLENVE